MRDSRLDNLPPVGVGDMYANTAEPTQATRRAAAVNRRVLDRATGEIATAEASRAAYIADGLETPSSFAERDLQASFGVETAAGSHASPPDDVPLAPAAESSVHDDGLSMLQAQRNAGS